jgi:hypothetical protein
MEDSEMTAARHGRSPIASRCSEELRDENGFTFAEAMDRICSSCYGEGVVCVECGSSPIMCELYTHCGDKPERHPCVDCLGTGSSLGADEPRGLSVAEDASSEGVKP